MMVFIIAGLAHILIPNYRWVLIHIFTLGIVTNAILVWSQHLTEKFVQHRLDDAARPRQVYRIYTVNVGAIVTLVGNSLVIPWVTITGAVIIAALMAWHCVELLSQWRGSAGKRFRPLVAAYTASAACLPAGAFFGGWLALDPGNPRLLVAHIACNVAGFVGLAAAASLTVLFPAIWRSNGISKYMNPAFALLVVGVVATALGALVNVPEVGLVIYTLGWVLNWQQWLGAVSAPKASYPAVSALGAVTWLVLSLAYYTTAHLFDEEPALPTLALLVGFAGQLLIGVMAYLLPTTMGGGPAAVRAGLATMGKYGLLRATLINGGLLLWVAGGPSWQNVVMSLLCLGALAVFPIFMVRGVKAQKAVLMKTAEGPGVEALEPRWIEVAYGCAVLLAVWVIFQLL